MRRKGLLLVAVVVLVLLLFTGGADAAKGGTGKGDSEKRGSGKTKSGRAEANAKKPKDKSNAKPNAKAKVEPDDGAGAGEATTDATADEGVRVRPIPMCTGAGGHRFAPKAPAAYVSNRLPLTCSQYAKHTCCNATHSAAITRALAPFFDDSVPRRFVAGARGVADECRTRAASLVCSSCDPLVGVGFFRGVCPPACERWYGACRDDWWALNEAAGVPSSGSAEDAAAAAPMALVPCVWSSLFCFALSEVVRSGAELCGLASLRVAPPSSAPPPSALPPNSPAVAAHTRALLHHLTLPRAQAPRTAHALLQSVFECTTAQSVRHWDAAAYAGSPDAAADALKPPPRAVESECFSGEIVPFEAAYSDAASQSTTAAASKAARGALDALRRPFRRAWRWLTANGPAAVGAALALLLLALTIAVRSVCGGGGGGGGGGGAKGRAGLNAKTAQELRQRRIDRLGAAASGAASAADDGEWQPTLVGAGRAK